MSGYLEGLRDGEYSAALIWEGHSQGWILFDCEQAILAYAERQISDETLGDPSDWGTTYSQLKALQQIIDEENSDTFWKLKRFFSEYERLTQGSTLSCCHTLLQYEELLDHFNDEYQEYIADENCLEDLINEGMTPGPIRERLYVLERMICARYDEPTARC